MRPALLAPAALLALAGCSVGSADVDTEPTAQSTAAIVVVERTAGPGDLARSEVIARFVRTSRGGVDEQALRIAGARAVPAVGVCASLDEMDAAPRPVELADVGSVTVESAGARVALVPRQVPDPVGMISGVIYSAPISADQALARTDVRVSGGELDGVTATATAPREMTGVTADTTARGLELGWDAGDDARDVVFVDVSARGRVGVRCAFADGGRGVVPAAWVTANDVGTLTLHRVRRAPFQARGLDAAELRFDFARTIPFGL